MYSVFEETREEGRREGEREGIAKGMEQGMAKGMAKGVIQMCMDFNLSKNEILEKLQQKMNIPLQKAEEYFQIYQNRTNRL